MNHNVVNAEDVTGVAISGVSYVVSEFHFVPTVAGKNAFDGFCALLDITQKWISGPVSKIDFYYTNQ